MASLYVSNNESNILIKIKSGNEIKTDVPLFEIDCLLLSCSSLFFDIAHDNKCIDDDIYRSKEKAIYIKDQKIIKPIMFDDNLKVIANNLHEKYSASLDSDVDLKISIDSNPIFESDISLFLNIIKNSFVLNKIKKHFNDDYLDDLLNDYIMNRENKEKIIDYFSSYNNYRFLREYLNENIYYLCLLLDNKFERYKVLSFSDKIIIDEYTMNFKDSKAIRKVYEKEILDYLEENKDYQNSLSRKNNGYVVILKHGDYGMERRKVLYSDTRININSFTKDLSLVKHVSKIDYFNKCKFKNYSSIFSPYQAKIIHYKKPNIKNGYTKMLNAWKKELFENKNYDLIRSIFAIVKDNIIKNYQVDEFRPDISYYNGHKPSNEEIDDYNSYEGTEEFLTDDEIDEMIGEGNDIYYSNKSHQYVRMRG